MRQTLIPNTKNKKVVAMFPMLQFTRILYAYWLGPVHGWLLCFFWEGLLIYVYFLHVRVANYEAVKDILHMSKAKGMLWLEIFALAASSLPIQVSSFLIESGGVSCAYVFVCNVCAVACMTLNCACCGYFLSVPMSNLSVGLISCTATLAFVLPTVGTCFVTSRTLYQCIQLKNVSAGVT